MADVVQRRLEGMVPELHYCLKRRLLTRPEVTALVRQRRAFEYRLHRRTVSKLDYLRYIRSELLVEELLRVREGAGKGGKPGKARYGALRRVVRLLWALIGRWGHQPSTARTALQIAAAVPNRRLLARLYGKLLQLQAHDVQLWSEAAAYEFTGNGNVRSARALFQRALRLNSASVELWASYHRLEAQHWQLVHDTRTAHESGAESADDTQARLQEQEKTYEALMARLANLGDEGQVQQAQQGGSGEVSFLDMAVPRRVATEALKQCSKPATLRALLHVYSDFVPYSLPAAMHLLEQALHVACTSTHAHANAAQWASALAEAPLILRLGSAVRSVDLCAHAFEAATSRFGLTAELLAAQLHVYRTLGEPLAQSLGGLPRVFYQKLFAQCGVLYSQAQQDLPAALLIQWIAFIRTAPSASDASAVALALCTAKPRHATLWCAVLQLLMTVPADMPLTSSVLHTALASSEPSLQLVSVTLDVLTGGFVSSPPTPDRLLASLRPHLLSSPPSTLLVRSLLAFFALQYELGSARRVADELLQRRQAAEVVLACVALEEPTAPRVAALLQQALTRAAPFDASALWAALVRHQHATHQADAALNSAWQARRMLRGAALASFERLTCAK